MVDGVEQNEPVEFFGMRPDARVEAAWTSGPEADVLEASHTGFERLPEPVVHRRKVVLAKEPFAWLVLDTLVGLGEHLVESFVQLAPEGTAQRLVQVPPSVDATVALALRLYADRDSRHHSEGGVAYERPGVAVAVVPIEADRIDIGEGWFAPRYGQRVRAPRLTISRTLPAGATVGYAIVRIPAGDGS
jgi:hypothetical protein